MMPRKFLLISRIGKKSLHSKWLTTGQERNFDVVLSSYDPSLEKIEAKGVRFEYRPGHKVKGFDSFLSQCSDIWGAYDYICLMDEDLDVDASTLNRMFDLSAAYDLKISQPSLTHDSHFTYAALLHQPQWTLRFVNFIEMMCPVFRKDTLAQIAPLYAMGYESGIDLIWCNAAFEGERCFAVLDAAQIRHTEPIGQQKAANGFVGEKCYEDDIFDILSKFDLPWLSCVPYAAIDRAGQIVRSKPRFILAALALLPAVFLKRPYTSRLRSILVHLKHLQFRRARNIVVKL